MTKNLFDSLAKRYESDKQIALSKIIRAEVEKELPEAIHKTLLDYGSGTGLISLELASLVEHLFLVDSSKEMTTIASQKINAQELKNAEAICCDLVSEDLEIKPDIILVSLVLLHIPDTEQILSKLFNQLKSEGQLIIVDFDFNKKINDSRVHSGFEQNVLNNQLLQTGFKDVSSRVFHHGEQLFMKQDASLVLTHAYK